MKIIFRKIGIITSQRGSMFQNSEILRSEKLFWLKLLYVLILIFLSPVVHDIQTESLWPNFEMMTSQHGTWISWFREKSFINKCLAWKFLLLSIFIFLSSLVHEIGVWALFDQFWVNDVTNGVKTAIFWGSDFTNKLPTSKFHEILILIFLSPSILDIQLWACFTQFWDNDVTKK